MIGYIVIFAAVYFIINFIVSEKMSDVAEMKGYRPWEVHAFAMVFWLGIIGCLYVIALPDKNVQMMLESMANNRSNNSVAPAETNASTENRS